MTKKLATIPPQVVAAEHQRVDEIMTRDVVTVPADLQLDQLFELLLERDLSRVPVVDGEGRLIGIVSKTDLVRDQNLRGDTEVDQRGAGAGEHVHESVGIVRDVMTPVTVSLTATTSVAEAARLLLAYNVHAAPVTSDDRHVIGIVSALDMLAWIAGARR